MGKIPKSPVAELDYGEDWTAWLAGETLATSEWTVPSGITNVDDSFTTTTAFIRLSGGTSGQEYVVVNRITTAPSGQSDERFIVIQVRDLTSAETDQAYLRNAIFEVNELVPMDVVPALTTIQVEQKVKAARLASTWAPNTVYNVGDVIVPIIRTNHSYECVQPGTSGTTLTNYLDWPLRTGVRFSDGGSNPVLTWREIGTDRFNPTIFGAETNIYDINRAAKECCLLKARKAAQLIDNGDESLSQIRKHWLEEATTFRPFRRQIELVRC